MVDLTGVDMKLTFVCAFKSQKGVVKMNTYYIFDNLIFKWLRQQHFFSKCELSKKFKFELGEKLDHRYAVKFHGESNGGSLEVLKRCLDPEIWPKIDKFKISSFAWQYISKVLLGDLKHIQKHVFSGTFGPNSYCEQLLRILRL